MDELEIIKRIKRLRKNRNITLKTLSKETGVTVGYLSRIENSQSVPPIPTLERIARGLGCGSFIMKGGECITARRIVSLI